MDQDPPQQKKNKSGNCEEQKQFQAHKRMAGDGMDEFQEKNQTQKKFNEFYIINASDAIFIKLVTKNADMNPTFVEYTFHPSYVHQMFGDLEAIHGYRDLTIDIFFLAGQLEVFLDINYSEMLEDADDIKEILTPFLTGGFTTDYKKFEKMMKNEINFQPLGVKVMEYDIGKGQNFELYQCDHQFPGFDEYKMKMQILLLFEIELTNYVEPSEHWKYLMLYHKTQEGYYMLAGILNKYVFNLDLEKTRHRISQVMVLPPFRRQGHGLKMLDFFYQEVISDPNSLQITVEDSSADFQPLRDVKDTQLVIDSGVFKWQKEIKNGSITDLEQFNSIKLNQEDLVKLQKELKITAKQIKRVFNILLLSKINMLKSQVFETYKQQLLQKLKQDQDPGQRKMKIPFISFNGNKKVIDIQSIIDSKNKLDNLDNQYQIIINEMLQDYKAILQKLKLLS